MLTLTPPSLDGLSNGYITSFNLPVTWPALSPTAHMTAQEPKSLTSLAF